MCTILLTRATGSDRSKAIGYVDRAIAVLEEHGDARVGGDLVIFQFGGVCRLIRLYGSSILWTSVSGFWAQRTTLASSASSQSISHVVCTDTGLVYLSASMVNEAKRWFECSTVLCRFVPDGRQRAEKVGRSALEGTGFTTSCNRFRPPIATYWHVTRLDEEVARPGSHLYMFIMCSCSCIYNKDRLSVPPYPHEWDFLHQ